jgi:type IV pilus assembly protein PilC
MPRYAYAAIGPDGGVLRGISKADSVRAMQVSLEERSLTDIVVTVKKGKLDVELWAKKVKREQVMHLSRQLSAFIRAGLPLLTAVRTLGEEADNPTVRAMLEDVEDGLRSGDTFSDCLDRHPKVFPDYYRGILRSAELTGQLDTVLDQLSTYLERDLDSRQKVKAALIYPGVIAAMSAVTVVLLSTFVLPRFKVFFEGMNAKLPLATRMLLAVTNFMTQWWWALLGGTFLVIVSVYLIGRTGPGRYQRDRLFLSLPVIGVTIRYALVERYCRILASMVDAGVALPEALVVASGSLHNAVYTRALSKVSLAVLEGEGIAGPLARSRLFPATAVQMMRVGEDTGTLDAQLEVTARYYERELDYKLKKVTALFEPAVIIAMGLIVGFVAVALVSAMYGVFNQSDVP